MARVRNHLLLHQTRRALQNQNRGLEKIGGMELFRGRGL